MHEGHQVEDYDFAEHLRGLQAAGGCMKAALGAVITVILASVLAFWLGIMVKIVAGMFVLGFNIIPWIT